MQVRTCLCWDLRRGVAIPSMSMWWACNDQYQAAIAVWQVFLSLCDWALIATDSSSSSYGLEFDGSYSQLVWWMAWKESNVRVFSNHRVLSRGRLSQDHWWNPRMLTLTNTYIHMLAHTSYPYEHLQKIISATGKATYKQKRAMVHPT